MGALSDQLLDLQMDDAVPMAHLMVDEGGDGVGGPNAPSPSESEATKAAAAAAAKAAAAASKGGSRSMLKAQKHQLELEEEKRIAAEMALTRLRKKAAERRRRASLSPVADGGGGGRTGGAMSPRTPGSPDNGAGGEGGDEKSASRNRRPSLLQRLGNLASSPLQSRRRSVSTPSSPTGKSDSLRGPATARDARESATGGVSDVDKAMALAVAAAEQMEGEAAGGGGGAVKGPTGAPQRSLARPKEVGGYVSNPTPRRRSKSGIEETGPGEDSRVTSRSSRGGESPQGGGGEEKRRSGTGEGKRRSQDGSPSPQRRISPELPKLQLGVNASATPALRSGRSAANDGDEGGSPRGSRSYRKSESLFEEEDENDLFHVLKEQTRAHDRGGEDKEVHEREEELRAKLKEAEQRCLDLQQNMERVRKEGASRGSLSGPSPAPVDPAVLQAMGLPQINIEVNPVRAGSRGPGDGGARARRGSYSRSASGADDDRASDFEDEPVPYCESNLEELHDAPTPVGNLVDRVQFLRDKCTQGLGQEKFEKALDLLQRMQEGDCRITVEGVEYDGNEDDDVEKVLVKVIGRHKLHYWNLMDQLLLMS